MCFSASASFTAGVVLTSIGIASIKKIDHPSQLCFAAIPFIFGVQQFSEGVLWLSLPNLEYLQTQKIATYIFLFFAQIIWPIWVPTSILLFEKKTSRTLIQKILVGTGILVGLYLCYCLITFKVEATIIEHHISYFQDYPPSFKYLVIILYTLAIVGSPFFSHIKRMWLLGIAIAISYIISTLFYEHYVLSVWCFFSSIISLSIYVIIMTVSKKESENQKVNQAY